MEQVRKIYNLENLFTPNKEIGLLIDEFFEYEEILNSFFHDILILADGFDFKKTDEIVSMLDDMDVSDESLMYFAYFFKDLCLDERLKSRIDVFSIVVCNVFHLAKVLNEEGNLLEDELSKVNDTLDLYRGMIYDFSRKLKRVFVG